MKHSTAQQREDEAAIKKSLNLYLMPHTSALFAQTVLAILNMKDYIFITHTQHLALLKQHYRGDMC